jgi:hypothetical protein
MRTLFIFILFAFLSPRTLASQPDSLPFGYPRAFGQHWIMPPSASFPGLTQLFFKSEPYKTVKQFRVSVATVRMDPQEREATITGKITGGWSGVGYECNVWFGTLSDTAVSPILRSHSGRELSVTADSGDVPVDSLLLAPIPAIKIDGMLIYRTKPTKFPNDRRDFTITLPLDDSRVVVFGITECAAQVFTVDQLLHR